MKEKIQKVKGILCEYGQEHLLRYFKELSAKEKESLLDQILSIDFDLIASLYKKIINNHEMNEHQQDLQPLKAYDWEAIDDQEKERLYDIGIKKIKDGKAAVILLAGGQGTRLSYSGPKGTFDIGLPSHKSLFQLQCERLINISRKCGIYINWYIMTSYVNHDETIQFFDDNNYFNYPKEKITFFKQGMLPTIDVNGKIFLQERGKISMAPNGNGGCFLALKDKGILTEMKERGIDGDIEYPKEPNGYKFESFIFDIFSHVSDMTALKVKREEEFAPVKNKDGEDSPFTAKNLVLDLHKNWLINSGVNPKLFDGKTVEISPLTSYNGENIDKEVIIDKLFQSDILLI